MELSAADQQNVQAFWFAVIFITVVGIAFFSPIPAWIQSLGRGRGRSSSRPAPPTAPRHVPPAQAWEADAPSPTPVPANPAWAAVESGRMPANKWLALLNDDPDACPHLLVRAPTRSGKTTFCTAVLDQRGGMVVVLTPKPQDTWGHVPSRITIDDDGTFTSIIRTFHLLAEEVKQRLVRTKRRELPGADLTIVIDDAPDLLGMSGVAEDVNVLIPLVGRLGASLRVRMVLITQSTRVKALKLEGIGDVLENFAQVTLTPPSPDAPRTASLTWGQLVDAPLDIKHVRGLAERADLTARGWMPGKPALETPETDGTVSEPFSAGESPETASDDFPATWKTQIAAGIGAGKGKTEILRGLPGYTGRKHQIAANLYDQVMKELGLVVEIGA